MKRGPRAAAVLAAALLVLLGGHRPPRAAEAPAGEPVVALEGEPYLSAGSLARLLGATRFWRADVRKLVLRAGSHRMVFTVDNPFVMLDSRTLRLPAAVRSVGGEVHVPLAMVDSLPRDSTLARLAFEPRGRRVVRIPPGGVIGAPRVVQSDAIARVTFVCERPEEAQVVGRARNHFRLRLDGFFTGLLPDSAPPTALVRSVQVIPAAVGTGFELAIGANAEGWRLVRGKDRVTLEIVKRAGPDFESFAPEGPPGPRSLRVIVLDPGHGGSDAGVAAGPLLEKDLTLELARALKPELERRTAARVFLTREGDVASPADQRAEAANRVRADLVLSLHFDGVPGTGARGITAYCPPATFGARARPAAPGLASPVEILPWRDVTVRHAVRAREIAETLLGTLELRGLGPARLRERLPYPLLGVNAPGLLIECGTLTATEDAARLQDPRGVNAIAVAIAEGVERWLEERP